MGISSFIWILTFINYKLAMKYRGYAQFTGVIGAADMAAGVFR